MLALLGIGGGLFWSAAYVNGVYNQEHTWITASRWLYENAVEGSVILWEQWDDPLPKSIPGEPGMDMGSQGLVNIDWGPYEEDTAEKFAILRQKLQEADYVAYSSKRIYDSVDELPQRYPMTNLYYQAMRDGRLGFELAAEFTSPPQLLGLTFEDRSADESWSLYDHPQVSIFHKVRDLSDEEFAALFDRAWEQAVPYYRGQDSPLSPFLNVIGLGSAPDSEHEGLLSRVIGLFTHAAQPTQAAPEERRSLMLDAPLATLPVVDNYRWNVAASTSTPLAILWWWLVLAALGWVVWPLVFVLCTPLRDRGYFLSRTFGWLLAGWLLWILVNLGLLRNLVVHAWVAVGIVAVFSIVVAVRQRRELGAYLRRNWLLLAAGELVFAVAYGFFLFVRLQNPDLWQPWFGGEKTMEFAFLNGILRSPSFPPVDPHFAGGVYQLLLFWPLPGRLSHQADRHLRRSGLQPDHRHALCVDCHQRLCGGLQCNPTARRLGGQRRAAALDAGICRCVAGAALCDRDRQPGWFCPGCAHVGGPHAQRISIGPARIETLGRRWRRPPSGGG